jgi:hypothetical protein
MFSKGDACKLSAYGRPLPPWTCEPNARCLVEAMRNDGDDWAVVGGFAIGPVAAYPVRHVWVRNGRVHFDPMWSRRFAVVLRKIRRLVFEELVRSYFDRTVRSDGEALRVRGFRPIDARRQARVFASRAGAYGYEVVHTAEAVWIRRIFRCSGQEAPLAIRKGPRWEARTPWDSASSKFFEGYAATKYGEGQRGLSANYPQYSFSPFASTDPERWVAPGFVAATAWAACCATTIRQLERGTSFRTVRWSLSSRRSPGNGVVTEYPYRRLLLYHAGLRRHFALDAHAARRPFQTYDPAQDGHGTLGREGQGVRIFGPTPVTDPPSKSR